MVTAKMPQKVLEAIKEDFHIQIAPKQVSELKLVEVEAFDDDLLKINVDEASVILLIYNFKYLKNSVRVNEGQIIIKKTLLKKVNSIGLKVGHFNETSKQGVV